ncbi:hypothetical protein AK812_SmicGene36575 [Symbiodinium microadriaticum]|uniref:Uncharacterized protein n=1 Tax=Symbiodinium microadriaticum TaxID=2951 RepID=A0A1Q9CIL6_SYMMI|nr:hypothetical protein AK812_SmicGene36575 [Symbiodinium microadriaticum]CAE7392485.1 unnamed protein product [Symbiodinium microadriaticum]
MLFGLHWVGENFTVEIVIVARPLQMQLQNYSKALANLDYQIRHYATALANLDDTIRHCLYTNGKVPSSPNNLNSSNVVPAWL